MHDPPQKIIEIALNLVQSGHSVIKIIVISRKPSLRTISGGLGVFLFQIFPNNQYINEIVSV